MGGWDSAEVVSIVLASTGIGLTVIGLGFVLWQVYQARGAAEAAREAATEAREAMTRHMTAADLGSVRSGLHALQNEIRRRDYESAWRTCREIHGQLAGLRHRPGLEHQQETLTGAVTNLSEIQASIESENDPDTVDLNTRVRAVIETVGALQAQALFFDREGNDHEQRSD